MAEDKLREEIDRLRGRVAALESICVVLLGSSVGWKIEDKRIISEGMLKTLEDIPENSAGQAGIAETVTKIAQRLVLDTTLEGD